MLHSVDLACSISVFTVSFLVGTTGVVAVPDDAAAHPSAFIQPLQLGLNLASLCGSDEGRRMLVHSVHKTIDWSVVRRLAAGGSTSAAGFTLVMSSKRSKRL